MRKLPLTEEQRKEKIRRRARAVYQRRKAPITLPQKRKIEESRENMDQVERALNAIEQIRINLVNLEQELKGKNDKDYINMIFLVTHDFYPTKELAQCLEEVEQSFKYMPVISKYRNTTKYATLREIRRKEREKYARTITETGSNRNTGACETQENEGLRLTCSRAVKTDTGNPGPLAE